ncbi:MAG: molybdopterin-dependent oxidoreductase [Actinomycetota bacterium]|nr:molybdopterin-dependent oxidoreductase [Actinomycetota bacterium]
MSQSRVAFLRGVFSMGAALLVMFAAHSLFPLASYPPARVQSLIVSLTPGDFATLMIERLGHAAMRALAVVIHLAVLLAGGYLAVWISAPVDRRLRSRRLLVAVAGLFAGATVLNLGTPGASALTPAVAYLLSAGLYGRLATEAPWLAAFEGGEERSDRSSNAGLTRRRFVLRIAWIGAGLAVATAVFRSVARRQGAVTIASAPDPWDSPGSDPAFPAVRGLTPEITPNDDFYNVDINVIKPAVDHSDWRLEVGGLVDRPVTLTYESLQRDFDVVEMPHTLTCISNEVGGNLVSTTVWRGVRLAEVLERAGVRAGTVDIVFTAADGYTDSIPLEKAREPTTLLVFGMNGVALPREHGFPARVIVPGIYGMKNVKWVVEVTAVDTDYKGYWMVRGWSDAALVKTQSRIDVPADGSTVKAGSIVAGVAWAGDRGLDRVEISDDRGVTWRPARLSRELAPLAWRRWAADLPTQKGRRRILVRAIDKTGQVQPSRPTPPHPDGASGHHFVDVTLV